MPFHHPGSQAPGQNQTFADVNRPDRDKDGNDQHSDYRYSAQNSFTVATVFIAMLTISALIMCFRLKSRLRTFACFATSLSLSTAVLGLLTVHREVLPIWYYAWNVIAESVGVIALNLTIVNVGNGFYPMVGKKHCYWKLSIMIIAIYGVVALVNVGKYIPQMVYWMEKYSRCAHNRDDGCLVAVSAYWIEARPDYGLYIAHQWMMAFSCGWSCLYLFIPLVRHHRRGHTGNSIQSDMVAVGVWYLSCFVVVGLVSLSLLFPAFFNKGMPPMIAMKFSEV